MNWFVTAFGTIPPIFVVGTPENPPITVTVPAGIVVEPGGIGTPPLGTTVPVTALVIYDTVGHGFGQGQGIGQGVGQGAGHCWTQYCAWYVG